MIHNSLDELDMDVVQPAKKAVAEMRTDPEIGGLGLSVVVVETRRELSTQMAYYSRDRMAPNDVKAMFAAAKLWGITDDECRTRVTWTLDSRHLAGRAFDAAPSQDGKTPWWGAPMRIWERMAEIAESHGFSAGYRWKQRDCPHFEM